MRGKRLVRTISGAVVRVANLHEFRHLPPAWLRPAELSRALLTTLWSRMSIVLAWEAASSRKEATSTGSIGRVRGALVAVQIDVRVSGVGDSALC